MSEDLGERTEDATPRRRQEARDEGNVPRSQDLSGAFLLLIATLTIWAASAWMFSEGQVLLEKSLTGNILGEPISPAGIWPMLVSLGASTVRVILPVLAVVWIGAALINLLQVGWLFAPTAVAPKLSKLDPIQGAKKIFGISGLVKAGLDVLKLTIVATVAIVTIMQHKNRVVGLPQLAMVECVAEIGRLMLDLALRTVIVLVILGVLDMLFQRWKYAQDLRMTKQQVKDEMKQTDGDPEVKRRRMRMQQQIAMQRVSSAVPKADVIVTNPEHLSIAIQYDQANMGAPVVVAKGADHLALRIRQIAKQHRIPIVERKPLARALYRAVDVNQEIPPDFYKAVAEILAYVYRIGGVVA